MSTPKTLDLENTLLIFTSDNGGLCTAPVQNMPTLAYHYEPEKHGFMRGGIRVPLLIKFPGRIKAGTQIKEPVINTDLYPTIL